MSQDPESYNSYLPPLPPPPDPPSNPWWTNPPEPPARRLAWHEVWFQMLTRPSVQSYREVLRDPGASPNRVYLWIFIASTIYTIAYVIGMSLNPIPNNSLPSSTFLFCVPFAGAFAILSLIITSGIYYLVARILRGEGSFNQMVYLYGALLAPFQLVNIIAVFIPYPLNACISGPLGIYALVLTVIVIEAVNGFGWLRSIATVLWWVPLACLCGCVFALLLSATGSATFQNIIDTLITPTP